MTTLAPAHTGRDRLALLAAARATVAGAELGEADPIGYLRHVLTRHGQLPPAGARPVVLLARPAIATVTEVS